MRAPRFSTLHTTISAGSEAVEPEDADDGALVFARAVQLGLAAARHLERAQNSVDDPTTTPTSQLEEAAAAANARFCTPARGASVTVSQPVPISIATPALECDNRVDCEVVTDSGEVLVANLAQPVLPHCW